MLRGLQQREGVERSVYSVSAELCCEGCSRGRELSTVLTVLALNCVARAAAEEGVEHSVDCVSAELCYGILRAAADPILSYTTHIPLFH